MCIIIDTNVLAEVFKEDSKNHNDFKPIKDWIINGKGKAVLGGSKYLEEIKKNYLNFFLQLKIAGKAIFISNDLVDTEQSIVDNMIQHVNFDDQHLVGLLRVSKCKLICSSDKRAYPYFTNSIFFTPAFNRPKIYSAIKNANLLCDTNIAEICKPCSQTTKKQKVLIEKLPI